MAAVVAVPMSANNPAILVDAAAVLRTASAVLAARKRLMITTTASAAAWRSAGQTPPEKVVGLVQVAGVGAHRPPGLHRLVGAGEDSDQGSDLGHQLLQHRAR